MLVVRPGCLERMPGQTLCGWTTGVGWACFSPGDQSAASIWLCRKF